MPQVPVVEATIISAMNPNGLLHVIIRGAVIRARRWRAAGGTIVHPKATGGVEMPQVLPVESIITAMDPQRGVR